VRFRVREGKFRYAPARIHEVDNNKEALAIMSRILLHTGLCAVAAVLAFAAIDTAGRTLAPGLSGGSAQAEEYRGERDKRIYAKKKRSKSTSTPEEIARYFQLYGGFIDPSINKQSQGGPFDSGFFFDSGMGQNGGDSPYMN
jgi:hypothetical protein